MTDDKRTAAARRATSYKDPEQAARIQEYITQQVKLAPPISPDRRAKLAELLKPVRITTASLASAAQA